MVPGFVAGSKFVSTVIGSRRARLSGAGIEIQGGTPEEFGAVIKTEIDKWGRIVKQAGIQPE